MKLQSMFENQVSLVTPAQCIPERCRALLFDQSATRVAGILRQKSGKAPYVVLPGGGVEKTDKSPLAAINRELKEELGLNESQYETANEGVFIEDEYGRQFYFIAQMCEKVENFCLGGPESERSTETSGTYFPQWFLLSDIEQINLVPSSIKEILLRGWKVDGKLLNS